MFEFKPGSPSLLELAKQGLSSTKDGYDLIAPKFDFTPFLTRKEVLEAATDYLGSKNTYNNAIDFCAGTGAGVKALLPIVNRRIVGIDWSAPMLAEARGKLDNMNRFPRETPVVQLVHADIFEIKYQNEFDLATCWGAFGHFERNRQKDFIALVHRTLEPGGQFVVDTLSLHWYSPTLWTLIGFDAVMRVRNLLWGPRFVMYYLHWLLPRVLRLFDRKNWCSVKVLPVKIKGKPSPFRVVIATKR